MVSWLTFAISLIKFLTILSDNLRRGGWIKQGRQEAEAEALKAALSDLAKANGVIAEFKGKGDEEVERTIEDKGWYRND